MEMLKVAALNDAACAIAALYGYTAVESSSNARIFGNRSGIESLLNDNAASCRLVDPRKSQCRDVGDRRIAQSVELCDANPLSGVS